MFSIQFRSIKWLIIVTTGIALLVTGFILTVSAAIRSRNAALEATRETALAAAAAEAGKINSEFERAMNVSRTLTQTLTTVHNPEVSLSRKEVNIILEKILIENPQFLGTYTGWEPNAFDGEDELYKNHPESDESGRFISYLVRNETGEIILEPLLDYEKPGIGDYYLIPKTTKREAILEPYVYPIQGVETLMTSLVVPVMIDDEFYGIAGVDFKINTLQEMADRFSLYDGRSEILIVSNEGIMAGVHQHPEQIGHHLKEYDPYWEKSMQFVEAGESGYYLEQDYLIANFPVYIGETGTPWAVIIKIPKNQINAPATRQMWRMVFISGVLLFVGLLLLWKIAATITSPIMTIAKITHQLSTGDVTFTDEEREQIQDISRRQDELGVVGRSFLGLIEYFTVSAEAAQRISAGDLSVKVEPKSSKDLLGISFSQMIANLKERILSSLKMADLGALAAGIAHELNSPFQVITAISASLIKSIQQGKYDEAHFIHSLEMINRNGWRGANIIRSLLRYARSTPNNYTDVSINELVQDTLLLIEHQLHSWDNIEVVTELTDGIPSIRADRNQLVQVIINLLTNARDAMEEGGIITIHTTWDEDINHVLIRISDTGAGIPDELVEKVFMPFFTTKPVGEGTGLGLSIAQTVVADHEGKIELESQQGKGTIFRIYLPQDPELNRKA